VDSRPAACRARSAAAVTSGSGSPQPPARRYVREPAPGTRCRSSSSTAWAGTVRPAAASSVHTHAVESASGGTDALNPQPSRRPSASRHQVAARSTAAPAPAPTEASAVPTNPVTQASDAPTASRTSVHDPSAPCRSRR
jgi:hypothetical protein